jgi:hypothetical protein
MRLPIYCIALVILLFSTCIGSAQNQDFLVTVKGDTVRGKLKILTSAYEKQVHISAAAKKKNNYSILQVRIMQLAGERYEPVKLGQSYVFMKLVKEGYLSLYAFQLERQISYDGRYLRKKDGQGMEVPNLAFKKNMAKFMNDCPSVVSKINEGEWGRGDLNAIIDEYNTFIISNTAAATTKLVSSTSPVQEVTAPAATFLNQWILLEEKVKTSGLSSKSDALEMIADIKNKLSRGEKIPRFLSEGLKASLESDTQLLEALTAALAAVN